MDTRRALIVDAFTTEPATGNGAGVVPDAGGLTDDQLQAIADELGQSETAFLLPDGDVDRAVRFFTPTQEVDLCGHATVAAHAHLHQEGVIGEGSHTLGTNVGELEITVDDGVVWMTQGDPSVREVELDYDRAADALGVDAAALRDVGADLSPARATTGLAFLMVPINFLEHLSGIDPDYGALEALAEDHDSTGVYAFTFDALEGESTLHARMFAPGAGVPEDPVTGTAAGACGAYIDRSGAFDETPAEMVFEQGDFVGRPGRVRVRVRASEAATGGEVAVGGRAVTVLDGSLVVPAAEEDDIIEV